MQPDCYGYLPHIQLCVCYYHLGKTDLAIYHNEQAGKAKPYSKAYLYNKAFFEQEERGNTMQMLLTANDPYPPIQVKGKNAYYARLMLSNVGGRNSEMGAVSTYFYNAGDV